MEIGTGIPGEERTDRRTKGPLPKSQGGGPQRSRELKSCNLTGPNGSTRIGPGTEIYGKYTTTDS